MAAPIDWQTLAYQHGWVIEACDPNPVAGQHDGPVLYHADLDRVWPIGDFEGACRDIGLTEEDAPTDQCAA